MSQGLTPEVWWSTVKTEAIPKGVLRWLLEVNGKAVEGEDQPDIEMDLNGYVDWLEKYTMVRSMLERNLEVMLPVVLNDPRYKNLKEYVRILDRVKVIRDVLDDYSAANCFDSSDDFDATAPSTTTAPALPAASPPSIHSTRPLPSSSTATLSRKRKAATSTPATPTPKRTPGKPFATPRSSNSSRVYQSPAGQTTDARAKLFRSMRHNSTWGSRCAACGVTDVDGTGHKTWTCTQDYYSSLPKEAVVVKHHNSSGPRAEMLFVEKGPMQGTKICWRWNVSRTWDGLCYNNGCSLTHICSLCMDPDHIAFDCSHRLYLPLLPPRPADLPPASVEARSQMSHQKKDLSAPASVSSVPSPRASSSRLPASTSVAPNASIGKYRLVDEFFLPNAKGSDRRPASESAKFPNPTAVPAPMQHPTRCDKHSSHLVPLPQAYHASVPRYIPRKSGYHCRIESSQILGMLDDTWAPRFQFRSGLAGQLLPVSGVDLAAQKSKDEAGFALIKGWEKKSKVPVTKFFATKTGKVDDSRFQYTDGDAFWARLKVTGHYPPEHGSPHAFTIEKDGTRMLAADGVTSPSLSGHYGFAFSNVVPIHFKVDPGINSLSVRNEPGSSKATTSYSTTIVNHCIDLEVKNVLERVRAGCAQVNIAYGSTPGKVHKQVYLQAMAAPDIETESIRILIRRPRMWEMGVMSLQTLVLKQRHGQTTRSIGNSEKLFRHDGLDQEEDTLTYDDTHKPLSDSTAMTFDISFLSHTGHPDRCCVFVESDHMSASTSIPKGGDKDTAPTTDVLTTLLEDLYFDRMGGTMFPRPSWKFTHRRIQSQLEAKNVTPAGQYAGLGKTLRELLSGLNDAMHGHVNPDLLPDKLARMYRQIKLVPDENGIKVNPNNVIDVLLRADDLRVEKMSKVEKKRN